jgi:hypothetical protein
VPGAGLPGTVLEAAEAGLVVACGTGAVRLAALRDMDGSPVCPTSLKIAHLPAPGPDEAAQLTGALAPVAVAEAWVRARLLSPDPVMVGMPAADGAPDWQAIPLGLGALKPAHAAIALLRAAGRMQGDLAFSAGPSTAPGLRGALASAARVSRRFCGGCRGQRDARNPDCQGRDWHRRRSCAA